MCGIFASLRGPATPTHKLTHRGPDTYTSLVIGKASLCFDRLAINGGSGGIQPFEHNNKWIVANAEIYNHDELGGTEGQSDCKVILPTVEAHGLMRACQMFSADFAFVYTDGENMWAARDQVGVRPLFYVRSFNGICFASEAKALLNIGPKIEIFPPGHLYDSVLDDFVCWMPNYWDSPRLDDDEEFVKLQIRELLEEAVEKRVRNTDQPVGFFLSGGLDSSIIAALGKKFLGHIRTFSIGLQGSPDLLAAQVMADHLESEHTEIYFTPEQGIKALEDVIWSLETYDTTTVRASVPMYLLSKYIRENTDIRVVLSGEGSDELFGGYLYFHGAPTVQDFKMETGRLIHDVHLFDVLRADRTTAAHGLELRVPFFDRDLIDYVMDGFDPELKLPKDGLEKALLREACKDLLPCDIFWRQKNGMSDAVGTSWVSALRRNGENYKAIFTKMFGSKNEHLVPYLWMPKWSDAKDPSATVLPYFQH